MCSLPTRRLAAMVAMVGLVLTGSAAAQGLIQDSDLFPVVGGPYESLNSAVFDTGTLQAEIVSVSLIGNGLTTPRPLLKSGARLLSHRQLLRRVDRAFRRRRSNTSRFVL